MSTVMSGKPWQLLRKQSRAVPAEWWTLCCTFLMHLTVATVPVVKTALPRVKWAQLLSKSMDCIHTEKDFRQKFRRFSLSHPPWSPGNQWYGYTADVQSASTDRRSRPWMDLWAPFWSGKRSRNDGRCGAQCGGFMAQPCPMTHMTDHASRQSTWSSTTTIISHYPCQPTITN